MGNKYGCYIKGRGWIKTILNGYKFKCCRNASDIHKDFLFKDKDGYNRMVDEYRTELESKPFECREISADELIDKRVVPCKKGYGRVRKTFTLEDKSRRLYFDKYCNWCDLLIDGREPSADGICVHCMMEFYEKLKVHYDAMDEDIKDAWARAKILDEI